MTILIALLAVIAGPFEPLGAGQKAPATLNRRLRTQASAVSPSTKAVVAGQAVDAANAPLPFVPIRLRNLDTGLIVSQTTTSHLGEFSFVVPGGATYIAEMIDKRTGQVLAVGPAVTVNAGEAVGVIVQLPAELPTLAGFFGNTAAAIMSAAAAAGITAVESTGDPVTPEQ